MITRISNIPYLEAELNDQYASLKNKLALAKFIDWLGMNKMIPDQDNTDQIEKARFFANSFQVVLTDTTEKLGMNIFLENEMDRLLVESNIYDICVQHVNNYLDDQLNAPQFQWPEYIQECLKLKSLQPIFYYAEQENSPGEIDQKNDLDTKFIQSKLKFIIPNFPSISRADDTVSAFPESSPIIIDSGMGSIDFPKCSLRQGMRGRIAELFVLEACWQNFLKINDNSSRHEILESIKIYYEKHDRYSYYRKEFFKNFDQIRQDIEALKDKESFYKLLDLTSFGLAGFDIIVPDCLWHVSETEVINRDIYCVEVKSVYSNTEKINAAEIILTTHEYRVAIQNQNYAHLLRLIAVPPGIENATDGDYSAARFIRDIDLGKIGIDNMKEVIFNNVRGGHFRLGLNW
jgi:hypothetical protein